MSRTFQDLTGKRFGRLTVIGLEGKRSGKLYWRCRCSCESITVARGDGLKSGDYVSCGCRKIEQLTQHGKSKTPEFKAWSAMLERCGTPTHRQFRQYGGRGIRVCDEWRSFGRFFLDVGPRPSSGHSLDRIDNDGNYEPGNVRWATAKVQANNRRQRNQHTGPAQ